VYRRKASTIVRIGALILSLFEFGRNPIPVSATRVAVLYFILPVSRRVVGVIVPDTVYPGDQLRSVGVIGIR
jgi:hypothetical protein